MQLYINMCLLLENLQDDVADRAIQENCGANNCTDRNEEAYVHEAFLADWRPAVSSIQVNHSMSNLAEKIPPPQLLGVKSSQVAEKMNNNGSRNWQSNISNEFPVSLRYLLHRCTLFFAPLFMCLFAVADILHSKLF